MLIKLKSYAGIVHVRDFSKTLKISAVRECAQDLFDIKNAQQILLYFQGKQMDDNNTLYDYKVNKNDVIQVMERALPAEPAVCETKESPVEDNDATKTGEEEKEEEEPKDKVTSLYFKRGDFVYCRDPHSGAWSDGKIEDILLKDPEHETDKAAVEPVAAEVEKETRKSSRISQAQVSETELEDLLFKVELDLPLGDATRYVVVSMKNIRACATESLKVEDVEVGMKVIANFNLDKRNEPGDWFETEITKVVQSRTGRYSVCGKILMGSTSLENCQITFCHDLKAIQPYTTLELRDPKAQENSIQLEEPCGCCKGDPSKACKECNCIVCGSKDNEAEQILCDECNMAYHIGCLNPPLLAVPTDDCWFCPECKVDANEIVAPGAKLKHSKKKENSASAKAAAAGKNIRDWGRGNATAGVSSKCTIVPSNHFGSIPGVEVGTTWALRVDAASSGCHRPPVAGISGRAAEGAFSIVLSGGYEDDVDNGHEFFYTGAGGRDLSGNKRTAKQSFDQTLTSTNLALARNCNAPLNQNFGEVSKDWKKGKPVRVLRGYKLSKHSKYAPEIGIRYDGLYKVVRYFPQKGESGFRVWRYVLRRDDPSPAPWTSAGQKFIEEHGLDEVIGLAELLEAKEKKKNEEKETLKAEKGDAGQKRKSSADTTEVAVPAKKAKKIKAYEPEERMIEWIKSDDQNDKLWEDCNSYLVQGKLAFMDKVREHFTCGVCQELLFKPVTTNCNHNLCLSCLQRAIKADIDKCPYCCLKLDNNLKVNKHLSEILLALFPGYGGAR